MTNMVIMTEKNTFYTFLGYFSLHSVNMHQYSVFKVRIWLPLLVNCTQYTTIQLFGCDIYSKQLVMSKQCVKSTAQTSRSKLSEI